jgi:tetratricopeptide (TPR) repeat protein
MTATSSPLATLLADGIRYERSGVVNRARECFDEVTQRVSEDPAAAAEAWWRIANLHRLHSSWDQALAAAYTGEQLAREHDLLNIQGAVWMIRGDFDQGRDLFMRTLEVARSTATRAKALQNLGSIAAEGRAFDEAERLFSASRTAYREAGDMRGEACSLLNIGRLQVDRGYPLVARETLEQAVIASRQSGDLEMYAAALLNLGIALGDLGHIGEAEERITTAYGQFTIADIPHQRVRCLMQLATLAARRDEPEAARVCLLHAREVSKTNGLPRELSLIDDQLAAMSL